jgi:hypothetical protein
MGFRHILAEAFPWLDVIDSVEKLVCREGRPAV